MSHFTVLVIGNDPEKQLAPFHEFECTGWDDEFVQDVDMTEEARQEYESHEITCYQDPEGGLHSKFIDGDWDPQFFRDPTLEETEKYNLDKVGVFDRSGHKDDVEWYMKDWGDGRGHRAKIKSLPEGWKEVKAKTSLLEGFAEFVEGWYGGGGTVPFGEKPDLSKKHKYGYILLDEAGNVAKVVDRTNPNKHWDWYQIGGRWNGSFKLKPRPKSKAVLGKAGLQRLDPDYKPVGPGYADQCIKGDIDVEGMRDEAGERAAKEYDKYVSLTAGCPPLVSWKDIQKKHTVDGKTDWDKAHKEYSEQPIVKAVRNDKEAIWWDLEDFQCSREEYIARDRANAIGTFAVVKDGQWYEKGEMGWWGCVHDEKDDDEWGRQFSDLFDSLPDDTLLTMVDCHI
jgi:hypothetical protein